MITFKEFISESISDKGIMKAIFIIGTPGAGKSYTASQMKGSISPLVVNTDRAGEFLSKKWKKLLSSETWPEFKDKTTHITKKMLANYLNGLLPLFVDGTSNNVSNILHRIGILESLGYDVGIIAVKSSLETAIKRAELRAKKINRKVDISFIESTFRETEENIKYLKSKVDYFIQIENDDSDLGNIQMQKMFSSVQGFFNSPVDNPVGKRMLEKMKENNQKYLVPGIYPQAVLDNKIDGWYRQ